MDVNILHKNCIPKIKTFLNSKGINDDPCNYFNESWLHLTELGHEINEQSIYRKARNLIIQESVKEVKSCKKTTQVCSRCKEDLPMGKFRFRIYKKRNQAYPDTICKDCKGKETKKWISERLPHYKKLSKEYRDRLPDAYLRTVLEKMGQKNITGLDILKYRKYLDEKRKRIKSRKDAGIKCDQDGRDNLADWYIRCRLKARGIINFRKEDIEKERQRLKKWRSQKFQNGSAQQPYDIRK